MLPSIWNENLWDEWFGFPELRDMDRAERKLYGRHADRLMKTDVLEHEDQYEVDIDLPGFAKEEIKLELNNGYLTINAEKNLDQNKEKHGKLIRQERYSGSMQRSFYVGEEEGKESPTREKDDRDRIIAKQANEQPRDFPRLFFVRQSLGGESSVHAWYMFLYP